MTATFNHPKPAKPQVVRDLDAQFSRFDRAMRNPNLDGLIAATGVLTAMMARKLNPTERSQVLEYDRQVEAYNAALLAYRAEQAKVVQARQNAAQASRMRAAACRHCYATHAGEC